METGVGEAMPDGRSRALARALCAAGLLTHAAFVSVSIAGTQIGLGVAAAGILLAAKSGLRPRRTPLDAPLCAVVAVAALSDLVSPFGPPPLSFATLWRSALGYWIVAQGLPATGRPARLARAMLLATAGGLILASAVGLVQYRTGIDVVHLLGLRQATAFVEAPGSPQRYGAMGFFTSRLTFGHNASAVVSLLLGCSLGGFLRGRARIFALFASALSLAAVAVTFDRAAYLALLAAAVALVLFLPERDPARAMRRRRSFALGLAASLLAASLLPGVRARFASAFDLRGNADRVFLWSRAREILRDHPLRGIGFGNYPFVCGPYYDRVDPGFPMRTWAHNSVLSLAVETGPLGLAAATWVLIAALAALLGRLRGADPGRALGALGTLVALLVIGQVHDVGYDTKVMYALWLALGVALSPSEDATRGGAPALAGA